MGVHYVTKRTNRRQALEDSVVRELRLFKLGECLLMLRVQDLMSNLSSLMGMC